MNSIETNHSGQGSSQNMCRAHDGITKGQIPVASLIQIIPADNIKSTSRNNALQTLCA